MKIAADARIAAPRPVVFATYRDAIAELLPYLPNVRGIEPRSHEEEGAVTRRVNVWHGGGEIPAVARAVIRESMLSWTDHATWDEGSFVCDWRVETHAFTEAVRCQGRHVFLEDGDGTRIETRGEIAIDATKIKAVPRLLASRVGHLVEEFLAAKIQPNLVEVHEGLARHLAGRGASRA